MAILERGIISYFDDLDAIKENVVGLTVHVSEDLQMRVPHLICSHQRGEYLHCVVSTLDQTWLGQTRALGRDVTINPMALEDIFLELMK
ncbi:MAG: hypothetical protein HRU25_02445 [Psychrobium sp.]|nr:hypothetical protein [Psychrobium sp.]